MRRARIKVLASVPIRRKIAQDTITSADPCVLIDEKHVEYPADPGADTPEKLVLEDVIKTQENEEVPEEKQDEASLAEVKPVVDLEFKILDTKEPYAQVNDKVDKSEENRDQLVLKSVSSPEAPVAVNTASPTKLMQSRLCFMRPVPRLDSSGRVRKNSVQGSGASASESEDEHGKRATSVVPIRVRNDSVCSVQSNRDSTINDSQGNSPRFGLMQKRRMLFSESARKLAEAKREFLLKHENKTPDRSQLKMYDLLYYNPVTNPMKKSNASMVVTRQIIPEPEEQEKDEDDPTAMPAPQVKVGPNGQLIIDEQSLVIEQTSVRKNREILAQEAIFEDDSYGGGFYKKRQKSKEWPKWETFKFYKALNVVGTDFLLMQSLFPNRTRQQIKQKYKKEERVRRHLVEKVLKYHQEFDTEALEEELAKLQNSENMKNVDKKSEKPKNAPRHTKNAIKRRRRLTASSIGECETPFNQNTENEVLTIDDEIDVEESGEMSSSRHQERRKNKKQKMKRRFDDNLIQSDGSSCTSFNVDSDSESDIEVYQIRPTRSGRLPKMKKLQGPKVNILDSGGENQLPNSSETTVLSQKIAEVAKDSCAPFETSEDTSTVSTENITTLIPDINQIEPGSLVILSKKSADEPENTILQVYMVSSNINNMSAIAQPNECGSSTTVNLSSAETLPPINNKIEDIETINVVDDYE